MINDKKNSSAKKKSSYSSKIHDFIDKLLDSPSRDGKQSTEKCNTYPKKEESKNEGLLTNSNIKSMKSDSTLFSPEKNELHRERNEIDNFDDSDDNLPSDQSNEIVEKISFEKNFFEECFKSKLKLSDIVKSDYHDILGAKIQMIMKQAMDD